MNTNRYQGDHPLTPKVDQVDQMPEVPLDSEIFISDYSDLGSHFLVQRSYVRIEDQSSSSTVSSRRITVNPVQHFDIASTQHQEHLNQANDARRAKSSLQAEHLELAESRLSRVTGWFGRWRIVSSSGPVPAIDTRSLVSAGSTSIQVAKKES